jgi:hypothetical protein
MGKRDWWIFERMKEFNLCKDAERKGVQNLTASLDLSAF